MLLGSCARTVVMTNSGRYYCVSSVRVECLVNSTELNLPSELNKVNTLNESDTLNKEPSDSAKNGYILKLIS